MQYAVRMERRHVVVMDRCDVVIERGNEYKTRVLGAKSLLFLFFSLLFSRSFHKIEPHVYFSNLNFPDNVTPFNIGSVKSMTSPSEMSSLRGFSKFGLSLASNILGARM